jgi:hypothetical protein
VNLFGELNDNKPKLLWSNMIYDIKNMSYGKVLPEERTKEIEKLMRRWIYIGTAALFLLIMSIILFYNTMSGEELAIMSIQFIIIVISIIGYVLLKQQRAV